MVANSSKWTVLVMGLVTTIVVTVKDEVSSQPMGTMFLCREQSNWQRKIPDPIHLHLCQS